MTFGLAKARAACCHAAQAEARLRALSAERSLDEAKAHIGAGRGIVGTLIAEAVCELGLSADALSKQGINERIGLRFSAR